MKETLRLDRLEQKIKESGLALTEVAERAGISYDYLYLIRKGERPNVTGRTLAGLASALGTTTDYLLGLTDDPKPRQEESETQPLLQELQPLIERLNKLDPDERQEWVESFCRILDISERIAEEEFEKLPPDAQEFVRLFDLLPEELKEEFRRELEEAVAREAGRSAAA